MSVRAIAEPRALRSENPTAFRQGFERGLLTGQSGGDTEFALHDLTRAGAASSAAGLIEGLSAWRAQTGGQLVPSARGRNEHHASPVGGAA